MGRTTSASRSTFSVVACPRSSPMNRATAPERIAEYSPFFSVPFILSLRASLAIGNYGRGLVVQIRIRHVSGSKAGTEQTFNADSVRLGREPSSDIAFDPYRDILVSGRHLELAFDGRNWVARDLGSTNGTYVNGERVTTHPLVSGEMLELGQGGPKIEVYFETPGRGVTSGGSVQTERPGTTVMSVNDLFAGRRTSSGTTPIASGADDGTTTLAPEEMAAIRAQATRATPPTVQVPAARKRVSSAPRIVLLGMLVVVAGLILFVIMGRKAAPPVVAADPARAEVERLNNDLAEKQPHPPHHQHHQPP